MTVEAAGPFDDIGATVALTAGAFGVLWGANHLTTIARLTAEAQVQAAEISGNADTWDPLGNPEARDTAPTLYFDFVNSVALVEDLIALGSGTAAENLRASMLNLERVVDPKVLAPQPDRIDPR